ncbi:MAG: undecaprenyldiphospho-muramoylpentapeptide beta-N-acetylglucosaminyltransferase [Firmicutes bacterium HGW-Firmicutes-11]|jgi:UDP-N-acetylglucosamine--N-acetylmuramyl-(pentapeptide) pyrophosphoryl-undecaprenol N-acetylglucosamine transferase|nr:MAG: undecaprenyldiphospho-muramoylpentapeptide beta-N-acetylglucosaminyltransferase [Firmicutes bacterium HGW-Firmicutes-11]
MIVKAGASMKIIMTGGGTGGHIYPAISIADKIRRKHPDAEILFIGTERGMEKNLVPQNGYDIRFISASGIHRRHFHRNFKTLVDFIKGTAQAKQILDEFRPDVVIGTGGYVCGPVIRAAGRRGIRTFLHEQNALPGLTNRLLERYAEKVFLSFPESKAYFKQPNKLVVTGNPIRKGFLFVGPGNGRDRLGLGDSDFGVLCFGGSLGSERINSVIEEIGEKLLAVPKLRLFFITGRKHFDEIKQRMSALPDELAQKLTLRPYVDDMNEYLLAADLVIGRAGALTIAEITACGKPSILIPSPNVTGNHQYYNAKVVADRGGAVLIEEKDLTEEKLFGTILRLMNHKPSLNAMASASASIGRLDSAEAIYDHLGLSNERNETIRKHI